MAARFNPFRADILPDRLEPKAVVKLLEEQGHRAYEALAGREDSPPEALFYIATEGTADSRRAAAANPSTPAHANRILADDADDDVRAELARKIGRLIPNLPDDASEKVRALTVETLERLARDQLPRVRAILAEEIKLLDCVPKRVVKELARDVESVAAPILEYSPLLSDADLSEIISTAQAAYVLVAIAKRRPVSGNISAAIAEALCVPAISALLANSSAEIRQQTLDKIIENGSRIKEWHLPLVLRSELSQRAIRRLAGFVGASLVEKLAERRGLDEETRDFLARKVREQIDQGCMDDTDPGANAAEEVRRLFKSGNLTDAAVEGAAEAGRRDFIVAALAKLANVPADTVRRILDSHSAKPVTALVWCAGLNMRTSFKIQTFVMRLHASELLPARGGVGFPLTEAEMRWHLDYFAVPAA
ncbi:MAG TPA: DUF2336 domain-containing protein [Rhizomicrobium sp.]|jgi:uncharacterized protein (DUF2336 family)